MDGQPFVLLDTDATVFCDKTLTLSPASAYWQIDTIAVKYTSGSSAGNRQLILECVDSDAHTLWSVRPGLVQAASKTYYYNFSPSAGEITSVRDTDYVMTPLPTTMALYGTLLHVWDESSTATDSDTMEISIQGLAFGQKPSALVGW